MVINGQSIDSTSDPGITQSVNRQVGMSNADVAQDYGKDNNQARGLLTQPSNFNSGLSYGDQATSDAIRGRYMPTFNRQQSELKLENIKNAASDHIRNLQVATDAAGQEVQMNKQKAMLKWKIEQQERAARGAILGQTLGIVGGVVGAVYGGGVGGAAGYQAGNAAGNAIGGS